VGNAENTGGVLYDGDVRGFEEFEGAHVEACLRLYRYTLSMVPLAKHLRRKERGERRKVLTTRVSMSTSKMISPMRTFPQAIVRPSSDSIMVSRAC
jgi:hypothetical protein